MKRMIYYRFLLLVLAFGWAMNSTQAQCLDWLNPSPTTGWDVFNTTFGGAPCDDGTGCPFFEYTTQQWQVWASEAYSIDGFMAGGTYAFSMCNGTGAGSWVPEFTIIAPSGAVDAFGPGDGDGCTITWTATENGTYLIVINEAGQCGDGPNTNTDNGHPAITCVSNAPCSTACNAGELTTTGTAVLCPGETFDLNVVMDTIPSGGNFGWFFSNDLGGTGALGGDFVLTGAPTTATYDEDLNGILSFNNLPPFSGSWAVYGAVYTDPNDAFNTICSFTADSLVVEFAPGVSVNAVDNGNGTATANASNGTGPYTYFWSDGQTTQTATGLTSGNTYTVTVTDANGCTDEDSVTIGAGPEPCLDWLNPSPSAGWPDFNNFFGGAPCDDGTGCPFNEITDFEVFASEAYSINGFIAGGTYAFSMCNGAGAGSWVPEFTIIAPSGAVDAFGAGDGDGCTITWTASEDGTYLIVINEAGQCGGGTNTNTENGFPAITCVANAPCEPCEAGNLAGGSDSLAICSDGGTFDIATDGTEVFPVGGGHAWLFSDELGGTGGQAGGFAFDAPSSATYDSDLNGFLSGNGLPPLQGLWVVRSASYDAASFICSVSTDSLIVNFVTVSVTAVDNGDGTATANTSGGTAPLTYLWSDGQTTQTATGLTSGDTYTVTVTDANGCTDEDSVTIGAGPEPCLDWLNPSPSAGWPDFNNFFGGAPCDDGTGCPFNEITDFEVFASEAYSINGFIAGGTYAFSMCNGAGAGSWVPEFTIIAPSGNVDAFGPGDGDGCTITWTASEDGTYLIVINEAGQCGGGNNIAVGNGNPALTCLGGAICDVTCDAGTLTTNGTVTLCPGETFDLNADMTIIPTGGGHGWFFSNDLGGTGALGNDFVLTGAPTTSSYNNNLNGILSANGLPVFSGTWAVYSVVYTTPGNAFNSICSFSADSLIVNFTSGVVVNVTDNNDGTATANTSTGAAPFTYLWSDGQTSQTATGLTAGATYTVTVTDANGCTDDASVTIGAGPQPCLDWLTPSPSTGYNNFNTIFGGAPCDDGTGCPFNEITDFEVWKSEAYSVDNFIAGGTYAFSMCNGPGAGSWVPEFTIIAPSGAVDAFGPGDGDGCTITWTASESGTYLIVINEAGFCGAPVNPQTDNGFPALTCIDNAFCDDPCATGGLTVASVVDNGNNTATVTASGGSTPYTYSWSNGQTTQTVTGLTTGTYTVTVTDANGCTATGSVNVVASAIENIEALTSLEISPNPTSGQFFVQLALSSTENVRVEVIDFTGKVLTKVEEFTSGNQFSFDLGNQPSGVYLLKISVNGEFLTRRLVVAR